MADTAKEIVETNGFSNGDAIYMLHLTHFQHMLISCKTIHFN